MPTQNQAQETANQINTIKGKINNMQEEVRLKNLLDEVEDIQSNISELAQKLTRVRNQGYAFDKNLEGEISSITKTWVAIYPNVRSQIASQSNILLQSMRPLETCISRLTALGTANPLSARSALKIAESDVDQLEHKIKATQDSIKGMYDNLNSQVYTITRRIADAETLLKNIAEATFRLFPTESGIASVKAVWQRGGEENDNDPEGVLFLTDQRIIFEQKEEIATKKVLFITTEKKKVQNLLFEIPVILVEKVIAEKSGMLKKDDHINITYLHGAPFGLTYLHIWQDCSKWQGLINRAKAKDFENDRAIEIESGAVDKVRNAPTQCPSCGAAITKPILRGQDTIKCEYCGFEIRL